MLDFPPPEDLSMAITNSCAAGGEVPRNNNQSKYRHYNSPRDRVYRQITNSRTINTAFYQTILKYRTMDFLNVPSFSFSNPVAYWHESRGWNVTIFNVFCFISSLAVPKRAPLMLINSVSTSTRGRM